MSEGLKQYLNDVFDGKNTTILEISQDLNSQNRFQSMVKDLEITTEQSLERNIKNIASMSFKDSTDVGCVVSLLLFSMELDSYHSMHSSSWYKRDMLVETLHDIFLCHDIQTSYVFKPEDSNLFWRFYFILIVCITSLVLNI